MDVVKIILLLVLLLGISCCDEAQKNNLYPSKEVYNSIEDYLTSFKNRKDVEGENKNVQFILSNNPWIKILNEDTYCCLFINNMIVYKGRMSETKMLDMSSFNGKSISVVLEFLALNKDGKRHVYRFINKTLISWEEEYKFIFACFLPTNENDDLIRFFPIKEDAFH